MHAVLVTEDSYHVVASNVCGHLCGGLKHGDSYAEYSGWARGTPARVSQAPAWNGGGAAVTKDGSQMTVVNGNGLDRNIPLVDVANNSKFKKKAAALVLEPVAAPQPMVQVEK